MSYGWIRMQIHTIHKEEERDLLSLVARGKRSLHMCATTTRPRLQQQQLAPLCGLCDLCAPKESTPVTLGSARLSSPLQPAAAACSLLCVLPQGKACVVVVCSMRRRGRTCIGMRSISTTLWWAGESEWEMPKVSKATSTSMHLSCDASLKQ